MKYRVGNSGGIFEFFVKIGTYSTPVKCQIREYIFGQESMRNWPFNKQMIFQFEEEKNGVVRLQRRTLTTRFRDAKTTKYNST